MSQTPKVGAFALETLTTGMYTNPLDTLREFIQNSADSIWKAESLGILAKGQGRIEIQIEPRKRVLTIRDNGIGIPSQDAYARLLNIGMSEKSIETDAGFRGIGRLAGIAYCRNLSFCTSSKAESVQSVIEMDCEGLRRASSPGMRQVEELVDIIDKNTKNSKRRNSESDHFFEVVMDGLTDAAASFLDWQILERYLGQVAPVQFDAQHFVFAPLINKWAVEHEVPIQSVTLVIRSPELERQVFKPYRTHYSTRGQDYDLHVDDICFYPESSVTNGGYWIWYGKTDLLGMITDDRAAGLRLRKNNISLGGAERITELFGNAAQTNSRFNSWYLGEVHVVTPLAIPNARRDGFEDIGAWPSIQNALRPFIEERCSEIRSLSVDRNRPTIKVVNGAQKVIDDASERLQIGLISEHERTNVLAKVAKESERVKRALETRGDSEDAPKLGELATKLSEIQQTVELDPHFALKKLRTSLDRKQRRIILEILQILEEALEEPYFSKAKAAILSKYQMDENDREA